MYIDMFIERAEYCERTRAFPRERKLPHTLICELNTQNEQQTEPIEIHKVKTKYFFIYMRKCVDNLKLSVVVVYIEQS